MTKSTILLLGVLVLPGVVFSAAALANQLSGAEQETVGVVTQDAPVAPKPATETMHGVVDRVDEANDTITLRLSPETTQQLSVQDGLLFNSVRFGDLVEVTVQEIAGAKTIVALKKE